MRNLRSRFVLTLLAGCCFTAGICHAQTPPANGKIKIGVSVPLTGPGAAYGSDIKNALIFANQRIANSAYELIIEDDHCSNKDAVSVAQKLTNTDNVKYMLGFGCSGTVIASAPVYEKAGVVSIASGTGAPAITDAGDYVFRTKPSLVLAGNLLAKEMASKFKKVGLITEETDYCQGLSQALMKAADDLKLETINENFLPGIEDFKGTLLRLKSKGVSALFLNPQGEGTMASLYKQLKEVHWNVPVYGTFMPGSAAFISALGSHADGIIYADVEFNDRMLNERGRQLYSEFLKEYGTPSGAEHFGALTLIAFSALDEAIRSGKDVKEYLYQNTFHGLTDGFSFDRNGDIVSDKIVYVLKILENSVPRPYSH